MKTIFPTATGFSGRYVIGYRNNPAVNQSTQLVGSVVIKRHYTISGGVMIPQNDSIGIRMTDELESLDLDDTTFLMTGFENDIAIFKPNADLIVKGSFELENSYAAHVTTNGGSAQRWLRRQGTFMPAEPLPDADAANNMFGWEQKAFSTRAALGNIVIVTPTIPDFSNFNNLFFNAFRRDFAETGFPLSQFTAGSRITLSKTPVQNNNTETVIDFNLGNEQLNATLFTYTGKGPDIQRYWCCEPISDIRLDTLIITPEESSASVLWRGIWDFNSYPTDSYRMLEVKAEERN